MQFVRNVKLFFHEGNSDKTYEIDLCKVGEQEYVVNFRYGKRTGPLKEGTKTITPVTLDAATLIFDALEKEKRGKGYLGEREAEPGIEFVAPDIASVSGAEERSILQRLQDAVSGSTAYNTEWKLSRVMWKAGEYRLADAVPYLMKLMERGDMFQRYSAIWSLGRCAQPSAAPVLKAYYQNKAYPWYLRQLAANALLMVLHGEEKQQQLTYFTEGLDPVFQEAILRNDLSAFLQMLNERVILSTKRDYAVLEDLYLVAEGNAFVKKVLLAFLETLPVKSGYFQHIRHLFKQSELRDDYEMLSLFAIRFERTNELFTSQGLNADSSYSAYSEDLNDYVQPAKELKKPDSRIAYSDRTRGHLRRRVLRNLRFLGNRDDVRYVKLATALLLQYEGSIDGSEPFGTTGYGYINGRYASYQTLFPANSKAVYLNFVLHGNNPRMQLDRKGLFWVFADKLSEPVRAGAHNNNNANVLGNVERMLNLFDKIINWFTGKKAAAPATVPIVPVSSMNTPDNPAKQNSEVPFVHLWQKSPDELIRLLIHAKMDAVHLFAMQQLQDHPDLEDIKKHLDVPAIRGLLAASSNIAQQLGLELAMAKYNAAYPSVALIAAMNGSALQQARELGLQWTREHISWCFSDPDLVIEMMFSPWPEVRGFVNEHLSDILLPLDKARILSGKVIAWILGLQPASEEKNDIINEGCSILERYCGEALRQLDMRIIEDLLTGKLQAGQAFAVRLLLMKGSDIDFNSISDGFLKGLLEKDFAPVRTAGLSVIASMGTTELVKRPELILYCCLADYTNVRKGIRPVIHRISQQNAQLALWLVSELVPRMMRKETSEGLHQDIANLLSNELITHLSELDTALVMRLLYSNYRPAQEFGVLVLDKYIPPASLTIKQVIATGNHELLAVREWCRRFFEQNAARIVYERDAATALLDATWDDTRDFAKAFFRSRFTKEDWSPESLISIADSVRPDVQAFGRELLTSFFEDKDGQQYLLKLSQHPSVNMQLFAAIYLERYAGGKLDRLKELEWYFYSVLTRVNKARAAKERIFNFLEKESIQSEAAAEFIGRIIAHVSATVSIGDKARCIGIMRTIQMKYNVELPLAVNEFRMNVHTN